MTRGTKGLGHRLIFHYGNQQRRKKPMSNPKPDNQNQQQGGQQDQGGQQGGQNKPGQGGQQQGGQNKPGKGGQQQGGQSKRRQQRDQRRTKIKGPAHRRAFTLCREAYLNTLRSFRLLIDHA